ncbi:hypothetical protein PFICI_04472 [Pestalotiopsis fici W106-1]|uniref:Uncharacterized protein n=1 Tax=Pestalotiopsis fici (strain W106-1 / CGMCC3.15140) TaxID=1229662 RepID=W3XBN5_PESFW|nr:uncharacterized protein PFICI_04472 [Pestalotiopsis fici W106-1]ETS82596.1 hypothetical protein PFICI_04472 [Pestalotiopsis fici W106-1]
MCRLQGFWLIVFYSSTWVRTHAQDYILEYFRLLTDRRKATHEQMESHIQQRAWYHYNAPPDPRELAQNKAALKRGIDEDWQASVQRYPEVLEYFYSLVDLSLPADDDTAVKDPPLSALQGSRANRRSIGTLPAGGSVFGGDRPSPMMRGGTPPIMAARDGRTTAPPMASAFGVPPPIGRRMRGHPGTSGLESVDEDYRSVNFLLPLSPDTSDSDSDLNYADGYPDDLFNEGIIHQPWSYYGYY